MDVHPTPTPCPHWQTAPLQLAPGNAAQAGPPALAWLQALCVQWAVPHKLILTIRLCTEEILTNIATHAHRGDGVAAEVTLRCGQLTNGVGVVICDDGIAFDPTAQTSPLLANTLDDAMPGGHGLRLVRHYTHSWHYRRKAGRNELLLVFAYPWPIPVPPHPK